MKKKELAKLLGVGEATIYRWHKQGILNKKIEEARKYSKLKKELAPEGDQNQLKHIIDKLDKIIENERIIIEQMGIISEKLEHIAYGSDNKLNSETGEDSRKKLNSTESINKNISVHDLAKILKMNKNALQKWIDSNKLKTIRIRENTVLPRIEALKLIFKKAYEDVNISLNAGDSVPILDFKKKVKDYVDIQENEINEILIYLYETGVLYLQTVNDFNSLPDDEKKSTIKMNNRHMGYITWINE